MPRRLALPLALLLSAAGCVPAYRTKGRISLYGVVPVFRPVEHGDFSADDIDLGSLLAKLKTSTHPVDLELRRRMGLEELTVLTSVSQEATADPDLALSHRSAAAFLLNELMERPALRGHLSLEANVMREVPGEFTKLLEGTTPLPVVPKEDASKAKPSVPEVPKEDASKAKPLLPEVPRERERLKAFNRALLQAHYRKETRDSQRPRFSGGYLKGPFTLSRNEAYAKENAVNPNEGYRFVFNNIHLRYTQKSGADFLVYVELSRGTSLKPFYVQVIARESDLPRRTDVSRSTVMTPAFTFEKDEPVLMKIVGIDLKSPEIEKAGETLAAVDKAAKDLSGFVPAAQFAPVLTKLTGALFELALSSNDIEFQYAISFYPYQSPQIRIPVSSVGRGWDDYYTELPLIAGQFVLLKDEDEFRRVNLESWGEVAVAPITRLIPCVAWWTAGLFMEPYQIIVNDSHWRHRWRFPGLFDEVVDKPSYEPIDDAYTLAVFNSELRQADSPPEKLPYFKEAPATKRYDHKTYVIFSVLRTDEGQRDPKEKDVEDTVKMLADFGIPRTAESTKQWGAKLKELVDEAGNLAAYKKVLEDVKPIPPNEAAHLSYLLKAVQGAAPGTLSDLLTRDLNRWTGQVLTRETYVKQVAELDKGPLPYSWDKQLRRWKAKPAEKKQP